MAVGDIQSPYWKKWVEWLSIEESGILSQERKKKLEH